MRGALGAVGVGLVALIFVAGPVAVSSAGFRGRDGRIAFAWAAGRLAVPLSCLDLFSIKPNGSDRQRLTRGCPWEYSDPAYSATGKQIVFVRGHEPFPRDHRGLVGVYVMGADGSHVRRVTTTSADENPRFSPDGKLIVFDRWLKRSRRTQLFLIASDGSHVHQLTHGSSASEPTFSPDGRRIAFVALHSHEGYDIYTVSPNGSHLRQLTHAPSGAWDDEPDFSPNGRKIVFRCGYGDFGAIQQVCIMHADGTHVHHVTPAGPPFGLVAQDPVFSPDQRRIAFLAQVNCRSRACGNNHGFVYTVRTDGSHRRQVYDLGPNQQLRGITWQPLP
jgi:Tol biopolymer transport system component